MTDRQGYKPLPQDEAGTVTPTKTGEIPPGKVNLFMRWKEGHFTIQPEDNWQLDLWDLCVITALWATAFLVPFEVALMTDGGPVLYVIGKVIDTIFSVDILLTFNIAYTVSSGNGINELYERRPMMIAAHYMSVPFTNNMSAGWFWPDLLTVIPWETVPGVKDLNSLRLVRVLRLVRMLRLVRVIKLFKRWHTHSGFSYSLVTVMTTASTTLMLVHWLACLWGHIGMHPNVYTHESKSWLMNHLTEGKVHEVDGELESNLPVMEVYVTALYFCTVVLTTVGFGDIVPQNNCEVVVMICTIFLTGITWAWVVANVVNVITNMDVYGTTFNQIMDDLNALMNDYKIKNALRMRIRRHIHESYHVQRRRHHQDAIRWLSAGLQGEFAIQSGVDKVCHCIWYFRGVSSGVLIELADEFKGSLYSPNEVIMDRNSASVVVRGSCIRRGKMYGKDSVIGEDMILVSEHLRDSSCPRTLTFLEVMTIQRDSLKDACTKYPDFDMRLRKAQVKLALWRSFIRTAEERKRLRDRLREASKGDKSKFIASAESQEQNTVAQKPLVRGWAESMDKSSTEEAQNAQTILQAVLDLRRTIEQSQQDNQSRVQVFADRFGHVDTHLVGLAARLDGLNEKLDAHRQMQAKLQDEASKSQTTNQAVPAKKTMGRWPLPI